MGQAAAQAGCGPPLDVAADRPRGLYRAAIAATIRSAVVMQAKP